MVVAAILVVAAGQPPKETTVDKDKLQGTWKAVTVEQRGTKRDATEGMQLIFTGDKFTMKAGEREIKGTFKVDGSKKPAQIDMTVADGPENFKDKVSEGVIAVEGDELKWCSEEPGKQNRPKEFATKDQGTYMLVVLKRDKK
jgi:uncharacterized protein (TIGR03067 family)